jgi:6-phosphogluconate dehydrogenase (decarboxylating)
MRMRSTGLGKTELEGTLKEIKKIDDVIVFYVQIDKPVKWLARMAFQMSDVRTLIFKFLKPKNIWFMVRALTGNQEKVNRSEAF